MLTHWLQWAHLRPIVAPAGRRTLSPSTRTLGTQAYEETGARIIARPPPQRAPQVPEPRGKFQTVSDILRASKRGLEQYEKHFESWDALFTSSSADLVAKNIDTRDRRYLLRLLEKFRHGISIDDAAQPTGNKRKVRGQAEGQQRLGRIRRIERKQRAADRARAAKHANENGVAWI